MRARGPQRMRRVAPAAPFGRKKAAPRKGTALQDSSASGLPSDSFLRLLSVSIDVILSQGLKGGEFPPQNLNARRRGRQPKARVKK